MTIVAFPSRAGKCLVQMKVDTERRGVRGGDLPGALGVQPYQDPIALKMPLPVFAEQIAA